MKKQVKKQVGKIVIDALPEDKGYKVSLPETLTDDDLVYLRLALEEIFAEKQKEIEEERRARGLKTYVEYRGDQVVAEY